MKALSIRVLCVRDDSSRESTEVWPDLAWKNHTHLCDVNLEYLFKFRGDIDGDPRQFAVLVHGAQPIPATALNHAIASINVEALLSIPLLWARRPRVCFL